jgi:hypothetical protein
MSFLYYYGYIGIVLIVGIVALIFTSILLSNANAYGQIDQELPKHVTEQDVYCFNFAVKIGTDGVTINKLLDQFEKQNAPLPPMFESFYETWLDSVDRYTLDCGQWEKDIGGAGILYNRSNAVGSNNTK